MTLYLGSLINGLTHFLEKLRQTSRVSLFFMRKTFTLALHQGKSVQNRGQSVILSGENHRLPYTIIGGETVSNIYVHHKCSWQASMFSYFCCGFLYLIATTVCGEWECWVRKPVHDTSYVTRVAKTDRPKTVGNSCVNFLVASLCHRFVLGVRACVMWPSQNSSFFSRLHG